MYHNAQCNAGYHNAQCNVPQSIIQCTTTHNAMQATTTHNAMYHETRRNVPQSIIQWTTKHNWFFTLIEFHTSPYLLLWSHNASLILGLTLHIPLITTSQTDLLFSQSTPLSYHFVTSGQSWKTNILLVCMVVSIRRFTTVNIVGLQYNITTPSPSIVI